MFGPAVCTAGWTSGTWVDVEAELRRDDRFVPHGFQSVADEFFVGERPIYLGGIEMGDAEVESGLYATYGRIAIP